MIVIGKPMKEKVEEKCGERMSVEIKRQRVGERECVCVSVNEGRGRSRKRCDMYYNRERTTIFRKKTHRPERKKVK